jgi:hypothetical protein
VGDLPQYWASFNNAPRRIQNGGWARSDYGKFYLTFCQIYHTIQQLSENRNPLVAGLSTFHDAEWLTLCEGLGSPHKAAAYKH